MKKPIAPERAERKAGKHQRIAKMLKNLVTEEEKPIVVDWLKLEENSPKK